MVKRWGSRYRSGLVQKKAHLFGTGSSPGCASLGLKQAADDGEDEYGKEAADFKRNDFYVDDRLQSVPNVEKAVKGFVAMQD